MREWLTTLRTVSCQLDLQSFPYREEVARRIRKESQVFFKSQRFGKNKRATIVALLYLVLRQYGKDRPLKEICSELSLDSKRVINQSWALDKTGIGGQSQFISVPRKTSLDYLFEHGRRITNNTRVLAEAEDVLMKIQRTGGNPVALASGALYHVCKNKKIKVSREQIEEAFEISHTNAARIRALLQPISIQKTNHFITRNAT